MGIPKKALESVRRFTAEEDFHGRIGRQRTERFLRSAGNCAVSFCRRHILMSSFQNACVVYQFAFPSFPVLPLALHLTSESTPFGQIPGLFALEHFFIATCFHLFLYPRAVEGSCPLPFFPHYSFFTLVCLVIHYKQTPKLVIYDKKQKVEHLQDRYVWPP